MKIKKISRRLIRVFKRKLQSIQINSIPITYFLKWCFNKGKAPDFIIIGVQKAGTTFLIYNLMKHPSVEIKSRQSLEFHFFNVDRIYRKGDWWYKKFFSNNGKLQGEKTPRYISLFKCYERMYHCCPDAKLILILRNPVTRAFSAYNHSKQMGLRWYTHDPSGSFEEHLEKEKRNHFKQGFIAEGFYMEKITRLLKYFKREQLLILISEESRDNPKETFDTVCDFLGIKKGAITLSREIHKRSYLESLKPETREELKRIYASSNEELFKFLGRRINEW